MPSRLLTLVVVVTTLLFAGAAVRVGDQFNWAVRHDEECERVG